MVRKIGGRRFSEFILELKEFIDKQKISLNLLI